MNRIVIGNILAVIVLFSCISLNAQDTPFKKKALPANLDKKEFRKAKKGLRKGNRAFKKGSGLYARALENYDVAYRINPNNAELNYKMGICYLKGVLDTASLHHLNRGIELDPKIKDNGRIVRIGENSGEIFNYNFMLGEAYHLQMKWDKAIENFKAYRGSLNSYYLSAYKNMIDKQIEECENGKKLTADPARVRIQNLGDSINSPWADYGAYFTGNESEIIFTSRRPVKKGPGKKKLNKLDNKYFEKIYKAQKVDGIWRESEIMKRPINAKGQRATAGMSNDGKRLFLYIDKKRKRGGNLYEVKQNKKGEWKKPKKMSSKINSKAIETSVALSYDKRFLYFVSTKKRRKHQGRRDIYVMEINKRGKRYKRPKNLGPTINTKYAEDYVWMHPDNKTLYFSSKGHNTMGGFDIFKSIRKVDGTWTEPVNLSYPINTPEDDYGIVIGWQDRKGYYTSVRPGGIGEKDIYVIKFLGAHKDLIMDDSEKLLASDGAYVLEPEKDKRNANTILKGRVCDKITDAGLNAKVIIFDHDLQKNAAIFETEAAKDGKYMVKLPSKKNYRIIVKADGYHKHMDNYKIPAKKKELIKVFRMDVLPKANDKMTLGKVEFAYNSAILLETSHLQLRAVGVLLKENPTLKIEVQGYTDNIGSAAYNKRLSESRAKSVVEFLVKEGIAKDRLTYIGYGEENPIGNNETENGRQMNRRTEFRITDR